MDNFFYDFKKTFNNIEPIQQFEFTNSAAELLVDQTKFDEFLNYANSFLREKQYLINSFAEAFETKFQGNSDTISYLYAILKDLEETIAGFQFINQEFNDHNKSIVDTSSRNMLDIISKIKLKRAALVKEMGEIDLKINNIEIKINDEIYSLTYSNKIIIDKELSLLLDNLDISLEDEKNMVKSYINNNIGEKLNSVEINKRAAILLKIDDYYNKEILNKIENINGAVNVLKNMIIKAQNELITGDNVMIYDGLADYAKNFNYEITSQVIEVDNLKKEIDNSLDEFKSYIDNLIQEEAEE